MSSLSRELVFLMLQFLDDEKFTDTVHTLEKESGYFFNMRYFEDMVSNGEWDEVENYLSGFTKVDDNRYSMKIFFEIRKQKYLEALDRRDHAKSVEILMKDLKVFATFSEDLFKEITMLLTMSNFRENEQLSKYTDTKSARAIMLVELKKLIEANPDLQDKLHFPSFKNSRLRALINQGLNWQHQLCKNQKPNPDIKTLFLDHTCGQPNGARAPSPVTNPLAGSIPKVGGFPSLDANGSFQPAPAGFTAPLAGWMTNPPSVPHQTVSDGPMGLTAPSSAASIAKRPRTTTDIPVVEYHTADSDLVLKQSRPFAIDDEIQNQPDNLPKTVVANLSQGSTVRSMDFHPLQHSLLLVGTNVGDISIWEVSSKERLVHRNFKVCELSNCSVGLMASLANAYTASVNRVVWSPDGAFLGVAYSKHIVQLFLYHRGTELRDHFEIDAHVGNVSDLAFTLRNTQLCIITCGEDKTVKVWCVYTRTKLFTFEGHAAPVFSVCPNQKENILSVFSTAVDGKIKAWLYDNIGSRFGYDAPGHSCTTMGYSTDGTRLFSCGTNKEGESFLVEWNENEGIIKRSYVGLGKKSVGVVKFDSTRNKYLAAGDEFSIKFWDMDDVKLLTTIDAEGGLPASPCIRFNKEGILLAVSTNDNGIKVLANTDGIRFLRFVESRILDASRAASGSGVKVPLIGSLAASSPIPTNIGASERNVPVIATNKDSGNLPDVTSDIGKAKVWKLTEINEPLQLRHMLLPDIMMTGRIIRLMYTNSGSGLLALTYNALHRLWKWRTTTLNVTGKASADITPYLWTNSSGVSMTNELSEANPEEAVPCFDLSKNDSYVISASGGKISLYNMMTFKTMTTFMPPPPAATSLAFCPADNNIVAIGMGDSTIHIYNVRIDEVNYKWKGHKKRVTGLAFSNVHNVLVSSGADSQLCVWSMNGWTKQASKFLQMPSGKASNSLSPTRVQFDHFQKHVLAVHETQIAIYEAPNLDGLKQWVPNRESSGAITDAAFSCDSKSIYVSFEDGSIGVLIASTLSLRCKINPIAYLSPNPNPSSRIYPVVLAAHPSEPNQFALGLTDGGVHVLEPLKSEGKWGTLPPAENGADPSTSSAIAASNQS